jgi:hypothetical protein
MIAPLRTTASRRMGEPGCSVCGYTGTHPRCVCTLCFALRPQLVARQQRPRAALQACAKPSRPATPCAYTPAARARQSCNYELARADSNLNGTRRGTYGAHAGPAVSMRRDCISAQVEWELQRVQVPVLKTRTNCGRVQGGQG